MSIRTSHIFRNWAAIAIFVLASGGALKAQTEVPDSTHKANLLPVSKDAVKEVIHYIARDSVAIDLESRRAFLYSEGNIDYQKMNLKADAIEVDFNQHTLKAHGQSDSTGKVSGRPYFKQDETEYHADTIQFNYSSQKGIISGVITQEGDGFLHGDKVKKINDSVMYLSSGQYTTCNHAHPHFAINFSKSKLITGNKIVTGPAYLSIEDVPTPLALPFAFFPMTHGRASGIVMPSYGWMNNRGYYLKDGGYYFALNDLMDLSLLGELYTNLSWAGEVKSNYYKRYKYKGYIDARYDRVKEGIRGDSTTYNVYSNFKIAWKHDQDAKANPYSRFSANVTLQSPGYNKMTTNRNDYFTSTTTSSISYTAQLGKAFNLAASFRESYNVKTGLMNIKLPSISLSSVTFYPLRRKEPSGSLKWYENISMSYVLSAENNLSAQDSDLLKRATLDRMQYGVQQSIPLSSSVKVLKFFNWTNSISYDERWHWSTTEKHIDPATNALIIDTLRGFSANHDVSFSSSLSTRLYGMFNFKFGPMKALRHVINPSVSFNYHPNMGGDAWREYTDTTGYTHRYSIYEQSLYGGPADGKSGRLGFSIGNNLEAKFKSMRDTVEELKKVMLIENLTISSSYDLAKDSLNWSNLSVTGRTTLFKNLVINYSGSFCPYVIDSLGRLYDQLLWDVEGRLFRKQNSTWSGQISLNLNSNSFNKKGSDKPNQGKAQMPIMQSPYTYNPAIFVGSYTDFSVPWNLSVSYTLSYVNSYVAREMGYDTSIIQTLSVSGNFDLTEKWKFAFSTGYDFVNKGMSYTSIDIYRDLHCWEMRFNWVPFGYYKSWNFIVNIKADALKDVKYEKREPYQDSQTLYYD